MSRLLRSQWIRTFCSVFMIFFLALTVTMSPFAQGGESRQHASGDVTVSSKLNMLPKKIARIIGKQRNFLTGSKSFSGSNSKVKVLANGPSILNVARADAGGETDVFIKLTIVFLVAITCQICINLYTTRFLPAIRDLIRLPQFQRASLRWSILAIPIIAAAITNFIWQPTHKVAAVISSSKEISAPIEAIRDLVMSEGQIFIVTNDNTIKTFDVATGSLLQRVDASSAYSNIKTNAGRATITASFDWHYVENRNKPLKQLGLIGPLILPGGFRVYGSADGKILIGDVTKEAHDGPVRAIAFSKSHSRSQIASVGADGRVLLWSLDLPQSGGTAIGTLKVEMIGEGENACPGCNWVSFSQDATKLVTADSSGHATIWDLETREALGTIDQGSPINVALFVPTESAESMSLVTAGDDGAAYLWDLFPSPNGLMSAKLGAYILGHGHLITNADLSADGATLVTGAAEGNLMVTDLAAARKIFYLESMIGIQREHAEEIKNSDVKAKVVDLTVQVSGLRNYKGRVILILWTHSAHDSAFPDPSQVELRDEGAGSTPCDFNLAVMCRRTIENLQNATVSYTFRDIPQGDYSAFVFHDENNNGVFDTGLFHRPLEGRGFSGVLPQDLNPVGSRILFSRARFHVPDSKTIVIGLSYPPRLYLGSLPNLAFLTLSGPNATNRRGQIVMRSLNAEVTQVSSGAWTCHSKMTAGSKARG